MKKLLILSFFLFGTTGCYLWDACDCKEALVSSPTYDMRGNPVYSKLHYTAPDYCIKKYGDPDDDVDAWLRKVNAECKAQ